MTNRIIRHDPTIEHPARWVVRTAFPGSDILTAVGFTRWEDALAWATTPAGRGAEQPEWVEVYESPARGR